MRRLVVFSAPIVKGWIRAFENIYGRPVDGIIFDCTALV
jgi:hypothetical protein